MDISTRTLILLFGVLLILVNCSKWKVSPYDLVPQALTGSFDTPTISSVQVQCQVGELGPNTLQEFGIVYSALNQKPTLVDSKVAANGTSGSAAVSLTSLQPNTTYYYRTYATNNKGLTGYGDIKTFTTAALPTINTVNLASRPSQLDDKSTTITITVDQPSSVTEYGMILTSDPNQANQLLAGAIAPIKQPKTDAFPSNGTLDFQITGLPANTLFYVVAYAKDKTGKSTFSKSYTTFRTKDVLQGAWRRLTDLPAQNINVWNPIFTINGKVYVGSQPSGASSATSFDFKQLYEYDPLTNLWTTKKDFPGVGRIESTVAVVNNKAYILFGYSLTNKTYVSDAWEYDPSTDNWRKIANDPPATVAGSTGVYNQQRGGIPIVYSNRVSSLFGRGPSSNATLLNVYVSEYILNPAGDGWDTGLLSNTPGVTNDFIYSAARSGAFSFQYGNVFYFGGGLSAINYTGTGSIPYSSYFNSRQIWTRDVIAGSLRKVAVLPSSFDDCSNPQASGGIMTNTAFVIGNKAYIFDCSHNTWAMDLTTNATPTLATNLMNPLQTVGVGVSIGTKAYWGLRHNDWWEFTP